MSNPSKEKGTKGETRVVNYLCGKGLSAERLALHGSADEGDIRIIVGDKEIRAEVKAGSQTANPGRGLMAEWMRQAMVESENSGCECVLIIARHRKNPRDYDVYRPSSNLSWTGHMYLDDYIDYLLAVSDD